MIACALNDFVDKVNKLISKKGYSKCSCDFLGEIDNEEPSWFFIKLKIGNDLIFQTSFIFADLVWCDNEFDFIMMADGEIGDFFNVAEALKGSLVMKKILKKGCCIYLDKLWVKEELRGIGIGSVWLKMIKEILEEITHRESPPLIFVAYPFEKKEQGENEIKDGVDRLINYYNRFGFKLHDREEGVMYWIK